MILAADIGGSKTAVCIFDKTGAQIDRYDAEGVGVATSICDKIEVLVPILDKISRMYDIESVAVNLGGKNKQQIQDFFEKYFPESPVSVYRESEGTAALASAEAYGAEIVILAGTGVISVAKAKDGCYVISGGWGANISDAGSGYDIGLKAVQMTLQELDRVETLSALATKISGRTQPLAKTESAEQFCIQRDEIRERIGPFERKNIASYTRVAAECGRSGDEECIKIFKEAGENIGELAFETAQKAGYADLKGILVLGGLVNTVDLWGESFENTVRSKINVNNFYYKDNGIIFGTYEIAKKQIL